MVETSQDRDHPATYLFAFLGGPPSAHAALENKSYLLGKQNFVAENIIMKQIFRSRQSEIIKFVITSRYIIIIRQDACFAN
jgi:hypothetical protein